MSLGKDSSYIFSKFNPFNTDTFHGPSESVLTGFDCNWVLINRENWERQLCMEQSWTLDSLQWLGISAVLKTVKQSSDVMSNARLEITGLGS